MRQSKKEKTFVSVYVNDFLFVSNNANMFKIIKSKLEKEFNVKNLKEVEKIIGCQIMCNPFTQTLKINQSSFICNLVIEENLIDCNSNIIPMKASSAIKIIKHDNYKIIEIKPYQHLMRKFMYLTCGIWPNIAFIIGFFNKYNVDLRKNTLQVAKKAVQYLKKIMQLGFIYEIMSDERLSTLPPPYILIRYANNNFAGDLKNKKLVIKNSFFLNEAVVL